MLKLNCRNVDSAVIGEENGLNLYKKFENYKQQISDIIKNLNQRKDKPGQWLQWMNLGYNEETVWYVKDEVSQDELEYMEAFYMGKVSEFIDEDMCSYYMPDDVVWKGKKAICDYLGFKVDETEIYDDQDKLIE